MNSDEVTYIGPDGERHVARNGEPIPPGSEIVGVTLAADVTLTTEVIPMMFLWGGLRYELIMSKGSTTADAIAILRSKNPHLAEAPGTYETIPVPPDADSSGTYNDFPPFTLPPASEP